MGGYHVPELAVVLWQYGDYHLPQQVVVWWVYGELPYIIASSSVVAVWELPSTIASSSVVQVWGITIYHSWQQCGCGYVWLWLPSHTRIVICAFVYVQQYLCVRRTIYVVHCTCSSTCVLLCVIVYAYSNICVCLCVQVGILKQIEIDLASYYKQKISLCVKM